MKKLALFILVVFVLSEVGVATQAKDSSAPYIRFDQEWWDFGRIREGDKASHTFKVENVGGADLVLQRVRPGCGCTVASVSSQTIRPGETAEIEAVFNSEGYYGMVTKFIRVESNDPEMPVKTLAITGEVRPSSPEVDISISPEVWKFFLLPEKETIEKFNIRNEGEQILRVKGITVSSLQYEISISSDKINPLGSATATLKIKPNQKGKSSADYIYLEIAIPFTLLEKAL